MVCALMKYGAVICVLAMYWPVAVLLFSTRNTPCVVALAVTVNVNDTILPVITPGAVVQRTSSVLLFTELVCDHSILISASPFLPTTLAGTRNAAKFASATMPVCVTGPVVAMTIMVLGIPLRRHGPKSTLHLHLRSCRRC